MKDPSINVLLWSLKAFFAAAATVYQESHFLTTLNTEGQELFAFPFKNCSRLNPLQEVQFMAGSNLTHAHSKFVCVKIQ